MSDIKNINFTGKELVVQQNSFLDSTKDLTLQEHKLFMFLISKVSTTDDDFLTFRVTASEFAKAIGVKNSPNIYQDLQRVTKQLMGRVVKIHRPEDKVLTQTHLVSSVNYWYGKGYVDIVISEDMKPYLLNLKREFTQYKLAQIVSIPSIYAIKIYELLKKQETMGGRIIFIDDLRVKLNIQSDQYKKANDLKTRVLEIAKREINSKTDLEIDFKFIKDGRKNVAVEFDIKSKNERKTLHYVDYAEKDTEHPKELKQVKEIVGFGFSEAQALSILDHTDIADAENAINAVKAQIEKGNAKNPKAMIRKALKEKWNNKTYKKTKKQHYVYDTKKEEDLENLKRTEQLRKIVAFGHSVPDALSMMDYRNAQEIDDAIDAARSKIKKGSTMNPKDIIQAALEEKWNDRYKTTNTDLKTNSKQEKNKNGFMMRAIEHFFGE